MNRFQHLFDEQKALFASNVTRSHAWRVEQLDRMGRMIKENEAALKEEADAILRTIPQELRSAEHCVSADWTFWYDFSHAKHVIPGFLEPGFVAKASLATKLGQSPVSGDRSRRTPIQIGSMKQTKPQATTSGPPDSVAANFLRLVRIAVCWRHLSRELRGSFTVLPGDLP